MQKWMLNLYCIAKRYWNLKFQRFQIKIHFLGGRHGLVVSASALWLGRSTAQFFCCCYLIYWIIFVQKALSYFKDRACKRWSSIGMNEWMKVYFPFSMVTIMNGKNTFFLMINAIQKEQRMSFRFRGIGNNFFNITSTNFSK